MRRKPLLYGSIKSKMPIELLLEIKTKYAKELA